MKPEMKYETVVAIEGEPQGKIDEVTKQGWELVSSKYQAPNGTLYGRWKLTFTRNKNG